jgi:hypothetical protein
MDIPENWQELPRHERKKIKKELEKRETRKKARFANARAWTIRLIALSVVVIGVYYWLTNRKVLPPTDIAGHIESNPESHILDKPMPLNVQKHMLEHADGSGEPGVVINYNCEDFDCEQGLIDQLVGIANQYPEFVYLAPFPGMSKKLAITRYQKIETFDSLDKEALVRFIEER